MFSSIKTSLDNKAKVTELTNKLNLGAENIIARIALTYSLSKGSKLDLTSIQDSKGKEYRNKVLFGNYQSYYVALICQHYGIYKTNTEIPKYLKLHIDDGVEMLFDEYTSNPNIDGVDFILNYISDGIELS